MRGTGVHTDAALTEWIGRPVTLAAAAGAPAGSAEYFADATDDSSPAVEWTMPPGRFVDAMALLVLTTASLRAGAALHAASDWDPRRFRPTSSSTSTSIAGSRTGGAGACLTSARSRSCRASPVSAARW